MSYATPLYYAAKSLAQDAPSHRHHRRLLKQRRRRITTATPNSAR